MASTLSWSCNVLILFIHIGICTSNLIRADGAPPELNIFHHYCALKKDEGPCKAAMDRYYFDIESRRCELFEYGGCQGNENKFETVEDCEEKCLVKANKSPCHLEEQPGPCRGLVPRYFYDIKSQACKRFFYGGCLGNANNFKSLKDCQATCPGEVFVAPTEGVKLEEVDKLGSAQVIVSEGGARNASHSPSRNQPTADVCLTAIVKGHCDGTERRFAYNAKTKKCQPFYYSGCGGNKNNFVHKRRCMKICMKDHSTRRQIRIKKKANIVFRSI